MIHVLDANCFMESKDRFYRFAVCPGYWDWLVRANQVGKVYSVVQLQQELVSGGGELSTRATGQLASLFLPPNQAVVTEYAAIVAWIQTHAQYRQSAKDRFLAGADPWLIACAKANRMTVVTLEVPAPASLNDIKIPDVCNAFGVVVKNPFQMLEDEGAVFILEI